MKKILLIVAIAFSVFSALVTANDNYSYHCTQQDLSRFISVVYTTENAVPCQVIYKKESDLGAEQILWQADNIEGYCEEKAETFKDKQEGWGWSCARFTE